MEFVFVIQDLFIKINALVCVQMEQYLLMEDVFNVILIVKHVKVKLLSVLLVKMA